MTDNIVVTEAIEAFLLSLTRGVLKIVLPYNSTVSHYAVIFSSIQTLQCSAVCSLFLQYSRFPLVVRRP